MPLRLGHLRNLYRRRVWCYMRLFYLQTQSALMGFAEPENFNLLTGEDSLSLYQFNTNVAKHYFCGNAAFTHHYKRSDGKIGFNTGALALIKKTSQR